LAHFESSYIKLCTLLIKDVDFIEFEPKMIAASNLAFLRYINKVSPIWNSDLEIITDLKFSQISPCFELTHKKYNTVFNTHTPKLQNIFYSPSNIRDINTELKLNKNHSSISDKAGSGQKVEFTGKVNALNSINTRSNTNDLQNIDVKLGERKPIFNYQTKTTVPLGNVSSSKYLNGTLNTEIPQRQPLKNQIFTNGYPQKSYNNGQDYLASYYSNNSSSNNANPSNTPANTTAASYLTSGSHSGLLGENFVGPSSYMSKNSNVGNRANSSVEHSTSYQSKLGALKK